MLPALLFRLNAYASTQIMLFSMTAYKGLVYKAADEMQPGSMSMIENLIYSKVKSLTKAEGVHRRFFVNCEPVGVGAESAANYTSTTKHLSSIARSLLRRCGIWF